MRLSIVGLFAIVIMVFASCSKSDSKIAEGSGDAELILAIQKATNKQNININELPTASRTVLSEDYSDDYVDAAKLAPKLGYEVNMRCQKGQYVGEYRQTYFDLSGRELRADYGSKGEYGDKGDGKGDHGDKGDKGGKGRPCFELVYPVTFIMQDGTEIEIDGKDDEEGWGEIKAWYATHPDVKERPALEFPVDIVYKDGTTLTINSSEEMREAMKECQDDKGDKGDKKKCFVLIYPVTYVVMDGTEFTIDSKDDKEGWMEIKAWYAAHPDVKARPELQFPVEIKWKDGTVETINSKEEMRAAKAKCDKGDKGDKRKCFRLVLPVTYTMPNGDDITVETREDYILIKAWYAEHPDFDEKPALQFPVDIKYKDGTILTINNQEEMKAAREECKEKDGKKRCFELVLPVTYIMPNGDEIIVEKKEDRMLIKQWYEEHPDYMEKPELQFPVDIKYKDGTVVTINNAEEMKEAKEDCHDKDEDGDKD